MKLKTGDQNLISRWEDKIQPKKEKTQKKKATTRLLSIN
jgi:hypothetical protein